MATFFASYETLRGDFRGRIHSSKIPDRGKLHDIAEAWLAAFFDVHIEHISFKATFAFQDDPRPLPYTGEESFQKHWVMSTKANALAHIRYVDRDGDLVIARTVFDQTGNAQERLWSQWGIDTAQYEIGERRRKGMKYPHTEFSHVSFWDSDPRRATSLEARINAIGLELTDLLLGVTADALQFRPGSSKIGRRHLARKITDEIAERFGFRSLRLSRYHRHFSVSLYPDLFGRTYAANPVPAEASSSPRQEQLLQI